MDHQRRGNDRSSVARVSAAHPGAFRGRPRVRFAYPGYESVVAYLCVPSSQFGPLFFRKNT